MLSKGKQNARDKNEGQSNKSRKDTERWRTFVTTETAPLGYYCVIDKMHVTCKLLYYV